ncbi:MAG: substrate-binding domain-containing protein [Planctomycetes bacterium]|nr:substrate-binding domain-containing protein [Planctomycetota bacterium]
MRSLSATAVRTRSLFSLLTLILVLLVPGCSKSERKNWTIVASFTNASGPEMLAIRQELEAAANRDKRIELRVDDYHGLIESQCKALASRDDFGDVLIIVADRPVVLDRIIHDLHQNGQQVIALGYDIGHDDFSVALLPDDITIGRAAGTWAANHLVDGGNIVALKGNMSVRRSQERQRGFLQGLTPKPPRDSAGNAAKLVYESETDGTRSGASRAMRDALVAQSKIDVVFAHSDEIAFGAYECAVAAGREREIAIIGVGGLSDAGLTWLSDGILAATLSVPHGGEEAVNYAMRILSGERFDASRVRLPSRLYTYETVSTGGTPIR